MNNLPATACKSFEMTDKYATDRDNNYRSSNIPDRYRALRRLESSSRARYLSKVRQIKNLQDHYSQLISIDKSELRAQT